MSIEAEDKLSESTVEEPSQLYDGGPRILAYHSALSKEFLNKII
jgi:hypothetical protein